MEKQASAFLAWGVDFSDYPPWIEEERTPSFDSRFTPNDWLAQRLGKAAQYNSMQFVEFCNDEHPMYVLTPRPECGSWNSPTEIDPEALLRLPIEGSWKSHLKQAMKAMDLTPVEGKWLLFARWGY